MLEAQLTQGSILKKVIDALKDLVEQANFECNDSGIQLQAMDQSHVALVSLLLRADGFEPYRCDRTITLGLSISSIVKILKCSGNDDSINLKAEDNAEVLSFTFNNQNAGMTSEYNLKLINIDIDHLGIPDTKYDTVVSIPSSEFTKIVRDLSSIGDAVTLEITKNGIKFSANGEFGSGSVFLKPASEIDDDSNSVSIRCERPVCLKYAMKYLLNFTKAGPLSSHVTLNLIEDAPLLIEYAIGDMGYLQYYLAPKVEEDS